MIKRADTPPSSARSLTVDNDQLSITIVQHSPRKVNQNVVAERRFFRGGENMLIRIVSSTDGGLDHTEFEIDGKMFGGDVQAVTFSHDCTKPYGPGKSNINIRMVYGDGKVWDSASGDPLPPIDDSDRNFDKVMGMMKAYHDELHNVEA